MAVALSYSLERRYVHLAVKNESPLRRFVLFGHSHLKFIGYFQRPRNSGPTQPSWSQKTTEARGTVTSILYHVVLIGYYVTEV